MTFIYSTLEYVHALFTESVVKGAYTRLKTDSFPYIANYSAVINVLHQKVIKFCKQTKSEQLFGLTYSVRSHLLLESIKLY